MRVELLRYFQFRGAPRSESINGEAQSAYRHDYQYHIAHCVGHPLEPFRQNTGQLLPSLVDSAPICTQTWGVVARKNVVAAAESLRPDRGARRRIRTLRPNPLRARAVVIRDTLRPIWVWLVASAIWLLRRKPPECLHRVVQPIQIDFVDWRAALGRP